MADELRKAFDKGYRLVKIHVIWSYEVAQYNPETREGGLFAEYVDTFLKIKQESSGYPEGCVDDAARKRYIEDYKKAEGISLDEEKIKKNPGLRSVAKLCLNSFWGKFGQRDNLPSTEIITEREQLLRLLTDDEKEVLRVLPINDTLLYATWQYKDAATAPSNQTNVAIAAYTTAQARLELYSYLERLDR